MNKAISKAINMVIVDGREVVRHGLRYMLEAEEDMKVVGDYTSGEKALFEMIRLHCDIVLMGTWMTGVSWLETIHTLKRNKLYSGADIIVLAESGHYRAEALKAGAAAYLLKDLTHAELTQTIRQVYQNNHSSKERDGLAEEAIELVIPPPASAACLMRFMYQLAEILPDGFANIICTVGSWNHGTTITIRSSASTQSTLAIALAHIAEVEKVEEEPVPRGVFPSLRQKFGLLPYLGINPSKRFRVALQETGMARQGLATELNEHTELTWTISAP